MPKRKPKPGMLGTGMAAKAAKALRDRNKKIDSVVGNATSYKAKKRK